MRTRKLGQWVTDTFEARQSDGTTVPIEEVTITAEDPTLTGTLWKAPPIRYELLRLGRGGGEVYDNGDGTLTVINTGERLVRCFGP